MLDAARVFWQQHTKSDALSMTMAELHDDVELVIRAARGSAQAGENEFVSRAGWVESAMRVYLIAGDTEKEARECAEYLCGEQDMDDLEDPIAAAMEDCEGRGAAKAAPSNGALAAPAQPVAWALQWPEDSRLNISTVFDTQLEATDYLKSCSDGVVVVPLYAAPQHAAHLAAKWQVVPRQLTQDMAEAAKFVDGRLSVFKYADAYRAMLYAAPQPAAQAAPVDAAVQQDAERLDFMIESCTQVATISPSGRKYLCYPDGRMQAGSYPTARAAIDAARAAQKGTND